MKKSLFIITTVLEAMIIVVILIVSILIIAYSYKNLNSEQKSHREDVAKLNDQVTVLTTNLGDANKKLADDKTKMATQEATITDLQGQLVDSKSLAKTNAENFDACQQKSQNDLAQSQSFITTLQSNNADLSTKITNLNAALSCTDVSGLANPDYTSNTTIEKSLEAWVGDKDGTVTKSTWDVLFSNKKTAIHYIDGQDYFWVFVVTFGSDPEQQNEVFWVGADCFLDRPK